METLRQLLAENGKDPGGAEALAAKYNYSPEALTDEDAQLIWQEETHDSGKLTKSNGKVTRRRGRPKGSTNRKKTPDASASLSHAAVQTGDELSALIDPLKEGADQASTHAATEMLNIIRNVPQDTLGKFAEMAMGEKADVDSFRGIGEEFAALLFPVESPDATE